VTLAALRLDSGELVWKAGERQVSYASPVLVELAGQRQIVSVNEASVTGHDPSTGRVLWELDWPGNSASSANTSQPSVIAGRQLLLTKGYGVGAALFEFPGQLANDTALGRGIVERWRSNRVLRTKFTSVSVHDEHAYGLNDAKLLEKTRLRTRPDPAGRRSLAGAGGIRRGGVGRSPTRVVPRAGQDPGTRRKDLEHGLFVGADAPGSQ
jgi:outer membrane protein assembly factor BamB